MKQVVFVTLQSWGLVVKGSTWGVGGPCFKSRMSHESDQETDFLMTTMQDIPRQLVTSVSNCDPGDTANLISISLYVPSRCDFTWSTRNTWTNILKLTTRNIWGKNSEADRLFSATDQWPIKVRLRETFYLVISMLLCLLLFINLYEILHDDTSTALFLLLSMQIAFLDRAHPDKHPKCPTTQIHSSTHNLPPSMISFICKFPSRYPWTHNGIVFLGGGGQYKSPRRFIYPYTQRHCSSRKVSLVCLQKDALIHAQYTCDSTTLSLICNFSRKV